MTRVLYFIVTMLFFAHSAVGQSNSSIGFLPKIILSNNLSQEIRLVNSLESRQSLYNDKLSTQKQYEYVLTDFTHIISFRTGISTKINAGYLFRIRANEIFHRTIQQLTFINSFEGLRLGHRIATDQTFNSKRLTSYRLRYRITLEKSLRGTRVDNKEWYLKINNEYLGSIQGQTSDLELRLMPFLGYELNPNNKIEVGIDYRMDSFVNTKGSSNSIWLSLNWYTSL